MACFETIELLRRLISTIRLAPDAAGDLQIELAGGLVPNGEELAIMLRGNLAAILRFACVKNIPDFLSEIAALEELIGNAASETHKRKSPTIGACWDHKGHWLRRHVIPERQITNELNARDIVTDLGRTWTRGTAHQILINKKYIGNNVWNRVSFKLKKKHVRYVNSRRRSLSTDRRPTFLRCGTKVFLQCPDPCADTGLADPEYVRGSVKAWIRDARGMRDPNEVAPH